MSKKNDYFAALREDATVERTLEYRGRTQAVHFRPLTAGERVELLQGQTLQVGADGKRQVPPLDLGDMTRRRHLLVQFMLVRRDGTNVYSSLAEVQAEPEELINALHALAEKAFDDEPAEAGNA